MDDWIEIWGGRLVGSKIAAGENEAVRAVFELERLMNLQFQGKERNKSAN